MRWRRWVVAGVLLLVGGVLLTATTAGSARSGALAARATTAESLKTFSSCADLVSYARSHFGMTHGVPEPPIPVFDPGPRPTPPSIPASGNTQAVASPAAPSTSTSTSAGAPSFSTTNDQEAGVDEPDITKTDGTTLFTVSDGRVYAVAVGTGTPHLDGSLDLGAGTFDAQLLLRGSRLIVITSQGGYAIPLASSGIALPPNFEQGTTIREIDVHDPSAMRLTRTMTIDGTFVDARQNGATARLVIRSNPLPPAFAGRGTTEAAWVPRRHFHSSLTGRTYVRPVAKCDTIRRPAQFSGLGMLTIFTLDLDRGLYTANTVAVMADAQVVYGSLGSLYVATQKWVNPALAITRLPGSETTLISRFDVSDPTRTTFVASGEVPGYLLNQFSLSEYQGYLRVATTSRPIWWEGGPPPTSSSAVTVLARSGARLVPVGRVTGLGAGQQIQSVRFVGDTGYVVTFRQVDPLYTIDLRSPAAPRVAGKLELAGYSAYLQPISAGLLLGIGQDVSPGNEPSGAQLELFDVSDPSAPRLVAKATLGQGSSSSAAYDHHALLFWPPTGLAVLPVQIFGGVPYVTGGAIPSAPIVSPPIVPAGFVGAIGYHIDASGIGEVGRIASDAVNGYVAPIDRSVVVGDRLFAVSANGVLVSSLSSLARQSFVAFPQAIAPPRPIPLGVVTSPPAPSAAGG